jgi:RNA polymerase sigma factor (sigma-70 family)
MATTQLDTLLRHIRKLAARGCSLERSDPQLLEDFSTSRDEAAFSTLVARHGPMVLRVCRRVLNHEQDAEDSFQATFVVLAQQSSSIRKPEALAEWLHGVAYRTAMEAKRKAARRRKHEARLRTLPPKTAANQTWDDVQAILDEEIQRLPAAFRATFVLCALEGKSGPEAAAALGIRPGTVSSRLTRARQRLQQRMARRGIELSALWAALAVTESAGKVGVPALLASATVRSGLLAAAGGTAAAMIPAHVATLAAGVTTAMFLTKAKIATLIVVTVSLLAGSAGVLTHQALTGKPLAPSETAAPSSKLARQPAVEVTGRVLDPEGRPFAGAKLYLHYRYDGLEQMDYPVRATSDADGRFFFTFERSLLKHSPPQNSWFGVLAVGKGYGPDWVFHNQTEARAELRLHLVPDVPIQGQILDLDGKPVKDAKLRIENTAAYSDTEAFLQSVRDREWPNVGVKEWAGPFPGQPRTLTTDAEGRFRLAGVGKDRLVQFQVQGSNIEWRPVRVLARDMKAPVEPRKQQRYGAAYQEVYPATCHFISQPSRLIRGVVRDKNTGRPVAGVRVDGDGTTDHATTDAGGRFELRGIPKSERGYRVKVLPAGQRYFSRGLHIPDTPGLEPMDATIELVSGIVVKGRVTHGETGKPFAGIHVEYNPLFPNPLAVRSFGPDGPGIVPCSWTETGPDGSYAVVVVPGPGALGFRTQAPDGILMPALVTKAELKDLFKDNQYHGDENALYTQASENASSRMGQRQFNELLLIDPSEKEQTLTRDVALQPTKPLQGKVLGPDGQPFVGATAYNLAPGVVYQPLREDTFTVKGVNPRRTRYLFFVDQERKLGAFLALKGEVNEPLTIKLERCGSVSGRVLDQDGEPVVGGVVRLETDGPYDSSPANVKTDSQGRFRFAGIVAGQHHQARFGPQPFLGPYLYKPFTIKAGESKDLGDVRLKRQP